MTGRLRAHFETRLADPTCHEAAPDRPDMSGNVRSVRSGRHSWSELWVSPNKPKGQRDHVDECRRCGLRRRRLYNGGHRRTCFYYDWQRLTPEAWVDTHTPKCHGRPLNQPFVSWEWMDARRGG